MMSRKIKPKSVAAWLLSGGVILVIAGLTSAVLYVDETLKGSLPILKGDVELEGLRRNVTIERSRLGVPTVSGDRYDVVRALGFLHAQERFFEMDITRRRAAGELAELFGSELIEVDKAARVHRFRARARAIGAGLPKEERNLLKIYTEGVNAGLAALKESPFEYLLLGLEPVPWRIEDSILTVFSMYFELQDENGARESMLGVMKEVLPAQMLDFLAPPGTQFDAPVDGRRFPPPQIPEPGIFAISHPVSRREGAALGGIPEDSIGSNNWAVSGAHTVHGGAMLANDMHLGLGVPNIWYRVRLIYKDREDRSICGVTLPGLPAIIVGSNGDVAWGFTNSYGDFSDLVILEANGDESDVYLTPDGPKELVNYREKIAVRGGEEVLFDVFETIWGPVIDTDYRGRKRAFHWVAHDPRGVNLALGRLEDVTHVDEALGVAARSGMPEQNFVAADRFGNIGWTIAGAIPKRIGHFGRYPTTWTNGARGWDGWLSPAEYPRIVNPPSGRIWTANARVVSGKDLIKLGDGGYAFAARAKQIRDRLASIDRVREKDLLKIQLDDQALFLARWQEVMLKALTKAAMRGHPRRRRVKNFILNWQGRAAVSSVGYRIVREFRAELGEEIFSALTDTCKQADHRFDGRYVDNQFEDALKLLIEKKPKHLLNPTYKNWDEQLLAVVDRVVERLLEQGVNLSLRTWGERNQTRIQHPLSRFLPLIGRRLDMPSTELPGDIDMPRFQSPTAGASERLVVAPKREKHGFFHMPSGQSGHPGSPYFGAGHRDWERGARAPFLPTKTVYTLTLRPE